MVLGSQSGSPSGGLDGREHANPVRVATVRQRVWWGLGETLGRPARDDDPECSWPLAGDSP